MLGNEASIGKMLGLDNDWAVNAIKAVGNYGEIFDRNLAARSASSAGSTRCGRKGGLQYAPPIR